MINVAGLTPIEYEAYQELRLTHKDSDITEEMVGEMVEVIKMEDDW